MSGKGTVRQVLARSFKNQGARHFGWEPPEWVYSGDQIDWRALNAWATGGNRDLTIDPRKLIAGDQDGAKKPLKLNVPALDRLRGATDTVQVPVYRRNRGDFNFRSVWEVGELVAKGLWIQNIGLSRPSYVVAEPEGGSFTEAGDEIDLDVTCERDDYYNAATASGTVQVVGDMRALAGGTARDDMETGKCWDGPNTQAGQELLEDFNNDVGGIKALAKELMDDLYGMSGQQLTRYMNRYVGPNGKVVPSKRSGKPPNIMWNIMPGLQVRYKPQGDDRRGPCFCIEGKTTETYSFNQDTCAFKVMPNGEAGPKGSGDTVVPQWVRDAPPRVMDAYMDAACEMTHLDCR